MKVLEHGGRIGRTLLFFPCTAEPVWVFEQTIALLAQRWHVFQVVFDGHEPEEPGDFTSVEQTVDEVTEYLKAHGIARLDAAYGCSLGGACLTRFLALGEIPVGRAIIDGGITPYQLPYLLRKLILARDVLSFKLAANDRKVLEAAFPPERFTIPGHDPVKEYDAMEAYLKTYSDRTIRNVFWSGNNYALPQAARRSPTGTATTKRRTAGAISASSSAISRRSGSTGSRKWRTRSWSSCIRRNSAGTRRNSWPGRRRRHSPSGRRIGG